MDAMHFPLTATDEQSIQFLGLANAKMYPARTNEIYPIISPDSIMELEFN